MRFPWSGVIRNEPENRGTLTFLSNGRVVLGMPHGTDDERATYAAESLSKWDGRKLLVFPFPVDVVDRREESR